MLSKAIRSASRSVLRSDVILRKSLSGNSMRANVQKGGAISQQVSSSGVKSHTNHPGWITEFLAKASQGFKNFYPENEGGKTAKEREIEKELSKEGKEKEGGNKKSSGGAADGGENSAKRKDESSSSSSKKESGGFSGAQMPGGSGGGGGGGKGERPPDMTGSMQLGIVSMLMLMYLMSGRKGDVAQKEISWQEFQSQLLTTGMVDRLIVNNKNIANVVLRENPQQSLKGGSDSNSSQAIDEAHHSVDAFGLPTHSSYVSALPGSSAYESGEGGGESQKEEKDNKFARYPRLGNPPVLNTPYFFAIGSVDSFERKLDDAQKQLGIAQRDYIPVIYTTETNWMNEALKFAPTLLFIGLYFAFTKGMGGGGMGGGPGNIFRIGKSKAKKITKEDVSVRFKDVAGCDEAKREIVEFVEFLKSPKKFTDLGAKIPRGALLCGPPGTGKTLLAKATAGEASVPFYSISGSDFIEMFVGVGPARVRDLFKEARENAPCIIFIDEIDAVGRKRGRGGFGGGNDERENTLNQLLVEMDGFDSTSNVVILAGTNRADVLDEALLRPGRFDRQIQVEKPDIKGRKAIFEVHLDSVTLAGEKEEFSGRLAALTPGFSGADIANICNEAAIQAARASKLAVDFDCFEKATDRIIGGLESKKLISPEERRIVAYHEAGHAVAGWVLEHADPLLKVTIVPRGSGALGYAQYLPKEIFLRTQDQILDMVCMALAGRASEQVTFGKVTTGASDDLRRVTQIVYQMVQVYGMNDKIGQVAFPREDNGGFPDKLYSDATAQMMDNEVRAIVDEAYKRTLNLMELQKESVRKVAELLLEKETITHSDVIDLIGARPYSSGPEYEEFLTWQKIIKIEDEAQAGVGATAAATHEENLHKDAGGAGFSPA